MLLDIFEFAVTNPEVFGLFGWLILFGYLVFEIRHPRGRVRALDDHIRNAITVIRGLARVHDEVDTEKVDEYLVENGMEPDDFIYDSEISDAETGFPLDPDESDEEIKHKTGQDD